MAAYGSRNLGDVIDGIGTIEQVSLTAYRVGSAWIPFAKVDSMGWAEPLIQNDGIQAVTATLAKAR